jgi:hypothetical protein
VQNDELDILKLLLDAGAPVNAYLGKGITALNTAAWFANYDAVKLLLDAGANVNLKGAFGYTALDCALEGLAGSESEDRYDRNDYRMIVELLKKAGGKAKGPMRHWLNGR